jgi:ATP-dependent Clp endopeptidase proteolytic subunit ClpP
MPDVMYRFWGHKAPAAQKRTPIVAAAPENAGMDGVAVLRLYDPIDSWGEDWGVSAKEFAQTLDSLQDVNEIRLHINSPGGEVFEGIAIMNLLRNYDAKVVAIVDGIAASAASFVAAGADEVVMARNAELMIHDAWGICIGNAADMRSLAGNLDHLSDNIASVYAEKAGGTVQEWRAHMVAETWYSAEEAVAAGLADSIQAAVAAPKNRFDLTVFQYEGRKAAPAPSAHTDVDTSQSAPAAEPAEEAAAPVAAADSTGPAAEEDRFQPEALAGAIDNAALFRG